MPAPASMGARAGWRCLGGAVGGDVLRSPIRYSEQRGRVGAAINGTIGAVQSRQASIFNRVPAATLRGDGAVAVSVNLRW